MEGDEFTRGSRWWRLRRRMMVGRETGHRKGRWRSLLTDPGVHWLCIHGMGRGRWGRRSGWAVHRRMSIVVAGLVSVIVRHWEQRKKLWDRRWTIDKSRCWSYNVSFPIYVFKFWISFSTNFSLRFVFQDWFWVSDFAFLFLFKFWISDFKTKNYIKNNKSSLVF